MNANNSYSVDALLDFLKQAGMQGLINPAAARSRRKALQHLSDELTDAERADVRQLDVDALVARLHKLEGASIRPETLDIYARRLRQGLEDFLAWRENPDSFISTAREQPRAFGRRSGVLSSERQAAERITLEATENPTNIVPVAIRDDQVVYLANLPLDLSAAEAERIARVVQAFAVGPGEQDEAGSDAGGETGNDDGASA